VKAYQDKICYFNRKQQEVCHLRLIFALKCLYARHQQKKVTLAMDRNAKLTYNIPNTANADVLTTSALLAKHEYI